MTLGHSGVIFIHLLDTFKASASSQRAIEDYDQAIRLHPQDALACNNRGAAYNKPGEYDRAIAQFTEAIELDPDLAAAYTGREFAYTALGSDQQAEDDLGKAVGLGVVTCRPKRSPASYSSPGSCSIQRGTMDQALSRSRSGCVVANILAPCCLIPACSVPRGL